MAETLLERMIQGADQFNEEHIDDYPEIGFPHFAVRTLTDPEDIRQFLAEYSAHMRDTYGWEHEGARTNPKHYALGHIGYQLHFFGRETKQIWVGAIPEVEGYLNPPGIDLQPSERPVDHYLLVFEAEDGIREAVTEKIRSDLVNRQEDEAINPMVEALRGAFDSPDMKFVDDIPQLDMVAQRDESPGSDYTGIKLILEEDRRTTAFSDDQLYVLLQGYVEAMKIQLEGVIGKTPTMYVDKVYRQS